jgi:hypothetical protein
MILREYSCGLKNCCNDRDQNNTLDTGKNPESKTITRGLAADIDLIYQNKLELTISGSFIHANLAKQVFTTS